jgi:hypothetical protein
LTFDRTLFDEMSFQTLWSEGLMAARLVAMSACKPTGDVKLQMQQS